jgi:protoheme IX farnesyltransferase
MHRPLALVAVPTARDRRRAVADLVALTKPRVVVMVLLTTVVGYYVGLVGPADYARLGHLVLGTVLAAGGALALNQYWERDVDALMHRTRSRPLPAGRLEPRDALLFGVTLTVLGVLDLAAGVNPLAALVTAAIVAIYVLGYTPLKLMTPLCTVVGAIPGALPPVTGWVAARDELSLGAWALFAIVFLWQLPHTLAIARLYRDDYARAGIRLSPVVDAAGRSTERQIVASCAALLVVGPLPTVLGLAGALYFTAAFVLGVVFVILATCQALAPSAATARRVLFASLFYLPVLLTVLALDKQ